MDEQGLAQFRESFDEVPLLNKLERSASAHHHSNLGEQKLITESLKIKCHSA